MITREKAPGVELSLGGRAWSAVRMQKQPNGSGCLSFSPRIPACELSDFSIRLRSQAFVCGAQTADDTINKRGLECATRKAGEDVIRKFAATKATTMSSPSSTRRTRWG